MRTMVDSAGEAQYKNAYRTSGILPDQTHWNTDQVGTFLNLIEVLVDYFINLAKTKERENLQHLSREILHAVHDISTPENITGHAGGDPVSEKKLDQGNGMWDVRKDILGWVFGGISKCIEYPTNK